MEGLGTDNKGGNNKYLQVMNGKLVLRVKEGVDKAVERINKNNEKVFELLFTVIKGLITVVSITNEKFGKELHISVKAGGSMYVLQMPASGGYAFGFLSRCLNIDFGKEVEIRPYSIPDEVNKDKFKNYLVVYQNGQKLASAFTKDAPNGLPDLEQVMVKGKLVWDDTKRVEFFEQMIYSKDGLNDQLVKLYGTNEEKEASPDTFLDEMNEVPVTPEGDAIGAAPELEETKPNIFAKKLAEDKTPNATAAVAKAEEEGAKAKAAKKTATKAKV